MKAHFAQVLARETTSLGAVTDAADLAHWRRGLIEELMTPRSPYAKALRQGGDTRDRAVFLDQWRDLIAVALAPVVESGGGADDGADVQRTAVLILAAVHGGSILSRVAKDAQPLNAALDVALGPLLAPADAAPAWTGANGPLGNMEL